ncbi:MAG: response regulator [Myxococcota bacterium]|nr:response regulator [Myxococcota bacterium]
MSEAVCVLIADDESQLLRLLVRLFEKQGYRVYSALDAVEAWTVFEAHRNEIDVVLLDVLIRPSGVAPLLSRMQSVREDLGVVLTSGAQLDDDLRASLDASGGVFLYKPFSPATAFEAIDRVTKG